MAKPQHDNCDPSCMHRQALEAAEAQQDREDKLNDEEHARIVADAKMAEAYENDRAARLPGALRRSKSATHCSPAQLRAMRVQSLEEALLEARAAMAMAGDDMGPLQDLRNVIGDALRLAHHKNASYGDAWKSQGYMGNLARIQSKNARLRHMLWCDPDGDAPPIEQPDGEAVRDTLLDLVNLAGFMLLNWEAGNRWGDQ